MQGEHSVLWASRTSEAKAPARASLSPKTGRAARQPDSSSPLAHQAESPNFFSPVEDRLVEESPGPLSEPDIQPTESHISTFLPKIPNRAPDGGPLDAMLRSAPAVLGPSHRKFTTEAPKTKHSLGTDQLFNISAIIANSKAPIEKSFELDASAAERARRDVDSEDPQQSESQALARVPEEMDGDVSRVDDSAPTREGWGESFPIEWICTERLPFFRTRHLRNPWNHDREIKVSRDGTELEPGIGQTLLDEWRTLAAESTVDEEKLPRRGPGTPTVASTSAGLEPRTKGGGKRL